jgi:hypothetical protein
MNFELNDEAPYAAGAAAQPETVQAVVKVGDIRFAWGSVQALVILTVSFIRGAPGAGLGLKLVALLCSPGHRLVAEKS